MDHRTTLLVPSTVNAEGGAFIGEGFRRLWLPGLGPTLQGRLWVSFSELILIVRFRRPTALGYRVQDRGHVRSGPSKLG